MERVEFSYRLDKEMLDKLRYISKVKKTTMNTILTGFVSKYVENYEAKNGYIDPVLVEIELKEDEEKRKALREAKKALKK